MDVQSADQLVARKCEACEGGVEACPLPFVLDQLQHLPGWELTSDQKRIRRKWKLGNFLEGLAMFEKIGEIAEQEAHHPDLHLENYREVTVEMWTHSIGGLSENDFIVAAKIDRVAPL